MVPTAWKTAKGYKWVTGSHQSPGLISDSKQWPQDWVSWVSSLGKKASWEIACMQILKGSMGCHLINGFRFQSGRARWKARMTKYSACTTRKPGGSCYNSEFLNSNGVRQLLTHDLTVTVQQGVHCSTHCCAFTAASATEPWCFRKTKG